MSTFALHLGEDKFFELGINFPKEKRDIKARDKHIMLIVEENPRFPEIGDKFFIEKGNQNEIAWIRKFIQTFDGYATYYQNSALALIEVSLGDRDMMDKNILPIIFLIRHYLELRLKEVLQMLDSQNEFPKTHNLKELWKLFKSKYSSIEAVSSKEFQAMDNLIQELSDKDPSSISFRYHANKTGKRIDIPERINLSNLKETFLRVSFSIDGIAMQIADWGQ